MNREITSYPNFPMLPTDVMRVGDTIFVAEAPYFDGPPLAPLRKVTSYRERLLARQGDFGIFELTDVVLEDVNEPALVGAGVWNVTPDGLAIAKRGQNMASCPMELWELNGTDWSLRSFWDTSARGWGQDEAGNFYSYDGKPEIVRLRDGTITVGGVAVRGHVATPKTARYYPELRERWSTGALRGPQHFNYLLGAWAWYIGTSTHPKWRNRYWGFDESELLSLNGGLAYSSGWCPVPLLQWDVQYNRPGQFPPYESIIGEGFASSFSFFRQRQPYSVEVAGPGGFAHYETRGEYRVEWLLLRDSKLSIMSLPTAIQFLSCRAAAREIIGFMSNDPDFFATGSTRFPLATNASGLPRFTYDPASSPISIYVIRSLVAAVWSFRSEWQSERAKPTVASFVSEWGEGAGTNRPTVSSFVSSWSDGSGVNRPRVSSFVSEWRGHTTPSVSAFVSEWYAPDPLPGTVNGFTSEWSAGAGVNRPRVSGFISTWSSGTGVNRPRVSSFVSEWQAPAPDRGYIRGFISEWAGHSEPAEGDEVAWVLGTFPSPTTAFRLISEDDADCAGMTFLYRIEIDSSPAKTAWASYTPFRPGEDTELRDVASSLLIAIIAPAGSPSPAFTLQARED